MRVLVGVEPEQGLLQSMVEASAAVLEAGHLFGSSGPLHLRCHLHAFLVEEINLSLILIKCLKKDT